MVTQKEPTLKPFSCQPLGVAALSSLLSSIPSRQGWLTEHKKLECRDPPPQSLETGLCLFLFLSSLMELNQSTVVSLVSGHTH